MIYLATRPIFPCLPFCPQHWWFQSQGSPALGGCSVPGFSISLPFPQGWKHCRHGAETGTAQWECQACSRNLSWYILTKPGGLHRCNSWSLLNATKIQLAKKMEAVEEPHALAFWGVFLWWEFFPSCIMKSLSSAASHLIHVSYWIFFMSSSTLCFYSFLRHILGFVSCMIYSSCCPESKLHAQLTRWALLQSSNDMDHPSIQDPLLWNALFHFFFWYSSWPSALQAKVPHFFSALRKQVKKTGIWVFVWTLSWCF